MIRYFKLIHYKYFSLNLNTVFIEKSYQYINRVIPINYTHKNGLALQKKIIRGEGMGC